MALTRPIPGCLVPAPIGQAIHRLLLIQAFRPDRLLAMAHVFVSTNLGESFMSIMEQPLDLTHIVDTEVGEPRPVQFLRVHLPCTGVPRSSVIPTFMLAGEAQHACPHVLGAWV